MGAVDNIVVIEDLRKTYGDFEAVKGISFELHRGEIFGLLGPNGAGKTTTISVLAGVLPATSGVVAIEGKSAIESSIETRRAVGVVPQELAIYTKLTGRENLEFFGTLYGMTGADLAVRVDAMLALVALSDRASTSADKYSGGMKRRLNLAAGLMHNPKLLLLDEPTVGVDPQSRHHIFEGVKELNRKGLTVLYTSHYMDEVEELCDRVGIMDGGKLVACDTIENLVSGLGGAVIEIGIAPDAEIAEPTLAALRGIELVCEVSVLQPSEHGEPIQMMVRASKPDQTIAPIVQTLVRAGVSFVSLQVKQPSLEDVFLSLTGKSLRD